MDKQQHEQFGREMSELCKRFNFNAIMFVGIRGTEIIPGILSINGVQSEWLWEQFNRVKQSLDSDLGGPEGELTLIFPNR